MSEETRAMTALEFKETLTELKFAEVKTMLEDLGLVGIHKQGKKKNIIIDEAVAAYQAVLDAQANPDGTEEIVVPEDETVDTPEDEIIDDIVEEVKTDVLSPEQDGDGIVTPEADIEVPNDPDMDVEDETVDETVVNRIKELESMLERASANFHNNSVKTKRDIIAANMEKHQNELDSLGVKR